jgi:magnesium transporter
MIKYYYKSLRSQELKELDAAKRGAWVYVEAPTKKELELLIKQFKLEEGHLNDALDEDEMPRLEREGDQTYIFVRAAYTNSHGELDTAPLLFIFAGDLIITISLKQLDSLDMFLQNRVEFATTQRTKLVLQILHQIVEQYDSYITLTSKQIKVIRARLRGHDISNQDFIDFVTIEDELNEFLSALMPTNATLRRLSLGRSIPLFEEDKDIVEDLLLSNEQSIEACRSNVKSIINIRQAYSSISSNNLNRTMKILTLVTVIIALPNTFFGMYGMNVKLPFQEIAGAYFLVVTVTIVAIFGIVVFLRNRRII